MLSSDHVQKLNTRILVVNDYLNPAFKPTDPDEMSVDDPFFPWKTLTGGVSRWQVSTIKAVIILIHASGKRSDERDGLLTVRSTLLLFNPTDTTSCQLMTEIPSIGDRTLKRP